MADQPPTQRNLFHDPRPPGTYFTFGRMPTPAEAAARRRAREQIQRREQVQRQRRRRQELLSTLPTPLIAAALPPSLRWLPDNFLRPGLETTILSLLQHPHTFFEFIDKYDQFLTTAEKDLYLHLATTILRTRWAFKRLVNAAIVRSIDRRCPIGQTDPITLGPLVNPVVIYSIPTRWRYAYDPTSLIAYIRTQLSACSYGYPDPQVPRNPITNMKFTLAQLYSAHMQLAQRGKLCWQLGAYLADGAHMERYVRQYTVALYKQDGVREALDVTSLDGVASIIEFTYTGISALRGINAGQIYVILQQAFHSPRVSTHPYLSAWRALYIQSVLECSSISVDDIMLVYRNDESCRKIVEGMTELVGTFPAFYAEVRTQLERERSG